jgi:hypothetical protein
LKFINVAAPAAGPADMTSNETAPIDMTSNTTTAPTEMNTTTPTEMNTTTPTDMTSNMTMTDNTTSLATNDTRFLQAVTTQPIPECDELDELFCEFLGGEELSDCCLFECISELQDLFVCMIKETTGEDRSDCEVPVCPTPAPVPATTKPKPVSGAGVPTGSRVAALAASLLAFAVL